MVLAMSSKQVDELRESCKVKFVDFGLEVRFPGGKTREIGGMFWFLVDLSENVSVQLEAKKIYSSTAEHQQSIEYEYHKMPTRLGWRPPSKDDAEKNWENVLPEGQYVIKIATKMVRSSVLSDSVVAQFRGFWNFTEEY
jgi:hypothetical protein